MPRPFYRLEHAAGDVYCVIEELRRANRPIDLPCVVWPVVGDT